MPSVTFHFFFLLIKIHFKKKFGANTKEESSRGTASSRQWCPSIIDKKKKSAPLSLSLFSLRHSHITQL